MNAWGKDKCIAVIDDSLDFSSIVAKLFKKTHYAGDVHFYPRAEAFYRAKITTPHLVISDLCMPQDSGLDVLKFVQENMPDTKFILVSGDTLHLGKALELEDSVDFFLKPIIRAEFIDKVRKCLTNY